MQAQTMPSLYNLLFNNYFTQYSQFLIFHTPTLFIPGSIYQPGIIASLYKAQLCSLTIVSKYPFSIHYVLQRIRQMKVRQFCGSLFLHLLELMAVYFLSHFTAYGIKCPSKFPSPALTAHFSSIFHFPLDTSHLLLTLTLQIISYWEGFLLTADKSFS